MLELANEIEHVLVEHDLAVPNLWAVKRLEYLATSMSGLDRYAAEKAGVLAGKAKIFYSDRRHANYPGGADALCFELRHRLLDIIRSAARVRANNGD